MITVNAKIHVRRWTCKTAGVCFPAYPVAWLSFGYSICKTDRYTDTNKFKFIMLTKILQCRERCKRIMDQALVLEVVLQKLYFKAGSHRIAAT